MPKQKTNSSAKKRFYVTGSGKIMHKSSGKRHLQRKKGKRAKRALSFDSVVNDRELKNVRFMLRI